MTNLQSLLSDDPLPSGFTAVEVLQEAYYLGEFDAQSLLAILEKGVMAVGSHPERLPEVLFVLRMLKDVNEPKIPPALFGLIERTFHDDEDYGGELWFGDAGRVLMTELLDLIFEYKRPADIPRLMNLVTWDIFHIPSHIFMLIRKHQWRELQDTITGRYDLREEYDRMIRTQHFLTQEALAREPTSEGELLDFHRKELAALRQGLQSATKPVVYVEGKTDRLILNIAYKKLYPSETMPFVIKECDVVGGAEGGSGGAQTLARLISSIRPDSSYAALALFDNDKEGIDAYSRLPKYFRERSSPEYHPGKVSDSGRAAALLIPAPEGRERYAELMNLSIEFLFDEDVLQLKNSDGRGLKFTFPELELRVRRNGNPVVEVMRSELLETREIADGKLVFASEIVPELDASKFAGFRKLFWELKDILLSEMKATSE